MTEPEGNRLGEGWGEVISKMACQHKYSDVSFSTSYRCGLHLSDCGSHLSILVCDSAYRVFNCFVIDATVETDGYRYITPTGK